MQISYINKQNFNSRNITIREADNLAREVKKMFPSVSYSKLLKFDNYKLLKKSSDVQPLRNIKNKILILREYLTDMSKCNQTKDIDYLIVLPDLVKKHKVANCGELSNITFLIAKCRDIKNCSLRLLADKFGIDMDHSVVYVNDKKPYIIDPWLGFADYVPEAIKRYNCEFRKFINFNNDKFVNKLIFSPPEDLDTFSMIPDYNINLCFDDKLRIVKKYPQFFVKQ